MSEYQYYEFQALDHRLDERALDYLRSLSSRAEITPTSLINVYHFGNFRGDPDRLMDKYFDAFLYVANWGTHRLMLRLPAGSFDLTAAKPYDVPNVLDVRTTGDHVILDFHSTDEEGLSDEEDEDDWLAALIPLRSELLAGDLRGLYLGWLSGVAVEEVDEDSREPPVPAGLGQLSGPQQRLAAFLRLDDDLIAAAAVASATEVPAGPAPEALAAWVAALPQAEKNELLLRVLRGEAVHLGTELLQRFRKEREQKSKPSREDRQGGAGRRTAGQLLAQRERMAEDRRRREQEQAAQEEARRAREQAAARARRLDTLAGREEELWRQVEAAVAKKLPKEYDHAVELLQDLRDLGERSGATAALTARLQKLRERHGAKRTFLQRLERAGLLG